MADDSTIAASPEGVDGPQGAFIPDSPHMEGDSGKRGIGRKILSAVVFVVSVVVFWLLLKHFVFQPYTIPSGSMEETIMTGDMVISEKISYYFRDPQPGDVVTFIDPEIPSRTLIKRVIATEGQTIDIRDGELYVDGVRQDEPYTDGKPTYPLNNALGTEIEYPYTVPADEIWVMGDNRTNSQDSRYFGAVPASSVTGRAVVKYWPLSDVGIL